MGYREDQQTDDDTVLLCETYSFYETGVFEWCNTLLSSFHFVCRCCHMITSQIHAFPSAAFSFPSQRTTFMNSVTSMDKYRKPKQMTGKYKARLSGHI
jgi:hypothetical protein